MILDLSGAGLRKEITANGGDLPMTAWSWGLLLKPLAAAAIAALYYFFIYRGSHLLGRLIKNDRLYDFLFRERGRNDPGHGARPSDKRRGGADNSGALTRRDRG